MSDQTSQLPESRPDYEALTSRDLRIVEFTEKAPFPRVATVAVILGNVGCVAFSGDWQTALIGCVSTTVFGAFVYLAERTWYGSNSGGEEEETLEPGDQPGPEQASGQIAETDRRRLAV